MLDFANVWTIEQVNEAMADPSWEHFRSILAIERPDTVQAFGWNRDGFMRFQQHWTHAFVYYKAGYDHARSLGQPLLSVKPPAWLMGDFAAVEWIRTPLGAVGYKRDDDKRFVTCGVIPRRDPPWETVYATGYIEPNAQNKAAFTTVAEARKACEDIYYYRVNQWLTHVSVMPTDKDREIAQHQEQARHLRHLLDQREQKNTEQHRRIGELTQCVTNYETTLRKKDEANKAQHEELVKLRNENAQLMTDCKTQKQHREADGRRALNSTLLCEEANRQLATVRECVTILERERDAASRIKDVEIRALRDDLRNLQQQKNDADARATALVSQLQSQVQNLESMNKHLEKDNGTLLAVRAVRGVSAMIDGSAKKNIRHFRNGPIWFAEVQRQDHANLSRFRPMTLNLAAIVVADDLSDIEGRPPLCRLRIVSEMEDIVIKGTSAELFGVPVEW